MMRPIEVYYVDDTAEFLETAQTVAKRLRGIKLVVEQSANRAFEKIRGGYEPDLLISDMVFFEEPKGQLKKAYSRYLQVIKQWWSGSPANRLEMVSEQGIVGEPATFEEEFFRLKNGKISRKNLNKPFEEASCEAWMVKWAAKKGYMRDNEKYYNKYGRGGRRKVYLSEKGFKILKSVVLQHYEEIPSQFALGGTLVLEGLRHNINSLIITTGHRHDMFIQMSGLVQIPLFNCYSDRFYCSSGGDYNLYGGRYFERNNRAHTFLSTYMEDAKKRCKFFWRIIFRDILAAEQNRWKFWDSEEYWSRKGK